MFWSLNSFCVHGTSETFSMKYFIRLLVSKADFLSHIIFTFASTDFYPVINTAFSTVWPFSQYSFAQQFWYTVESQKIIEE